jgi:hypothetical protein
MRPHELRETCAGNNHNQERKKLMLTIRAKTLLAFDIVWKRQRFLLNLSASSWWLSNRRLWIDRIWIAQGRLDWKQALARALEKIADETADSFRR